jgi:molybdate transport system regulatory protein
MSSPHKRPATLTPRVKIWLETDDGFAFGFGLIQILQAIGRAGSIKAAAADLERSYRHIWNRIKEAESALRVPLVETQVGGQGTQRSTLTDAAQTLIDDFLSLKARMIASLGDHAKPMADTKNM